MFAVLVVSMSVIFTFASGELECGIRNNERLIGGITAQLFDYGWNAIVLKKDGNKDDLKCGGALISTQHIVTSAACVSSIKQTNGWYVRLGEHNLSEEKDCADIVDSLYCQFQTDYQIEKIIPHEHFKRGQNKIDNDIAIIKLATAVNITEGVSTVCLPQPEEKPDNERLLSYGDISGWQIGSSVAHKIIKHGDTLTIISNEECQKLLKNTFILTDNNICTKSKARDPKYLFCSTDLGGPLTRMNKNYRSALIGVMSYAANSCEYPAVFTKVENYLDWIQKNI